MTGDRPVQARGKFMHHPGDDDSAAVTFWGKKDLRRALVKALALLDDHFEKLGRPRVLTRDQYVVAMDFNGDEI